MRNFLLCVGFLVGLAVVAVVQHYLGRLFFATVKAVVKAAWPASKHAVIVGDDEVQNGETRPRQESVSSRCE